jgi:heat shock protein HslJ
MARTGTPAHRLSILVIAAGLALGACGDDSEDSSSTTPEAPSADDLDGHTFVSTGITGQTLVEGTQVTLDFDGGNMATVAGCNTHTGGFAVEDGALVVDQLASTRMMCDEESMAQDEWLVTMLSASPAVTLADGTLILSSPEITITLVDRETLDGENALVGAWAIASLGDEAAPEGANLAFAADMLAVATGCNRGSGGYTVDGDGVAIGPLAVTLMACEEPLATWETTLLTFLESSLTFTVDGDTLTLSDGTTELTAEHIP